MSSHIHIHGKFETSNGPKDFELDIHINKDHIFHGTFESDYYKDDLPVIGFFYTNYEEKRLVFAHAFSKNIHKLSVFYSLSQLAPTHWTFFGHWGEPHGKRAFVDFHPHDFNSSSVLHKLAHFASQIQKGRHNKVKFRESSLAKPLRTLMFDLDHL